VCVAAGFIPLVVSNHAVITAKLSLKMASTTTRSLHSSPIASSASADSLALPQPPAEHTPLATMERAPLSVLPLTTVLRSFATTTISASPRLLPVSLAVMSALAHTNYAILNPDKNILLRFLVRNTFYKQFCAGENPAEVRRTVDRLKRMGFAGVILGYAREVVLTDEQTKTLASCDQGAAAEECVRHEITPWAAGTRETVMLAEPGDYVALK